MFDALLARGQVRLHVDAEAMRETVAATAAASNADGRQVAVVVDTRDQAAALNAAIRDQLVDAGQVRPYLPALPHDAKQLAHVADRSDNRTALWQAFDAAARTQAEQAHPESAGLRAAADAARQQHEQARSALAEADRRRDQRLRRMGPAAWTPDPETRLPELDRDIAATRQELTDARARIASLKAERLALPRTEPAAQAEPADPLTREHDAWRARRDAAQRTARNKSRPAAVSESAIRRPPPPSLSPHPRGGPGIAR